MNWIEHKSTWNGPINIKFSRTKIELNRNRKSNLTELKNQTWNCRKFNLTQLKIMCALRLVESGWANRWTRLKISVNFISCEATVQDFVWYCYRYRPVSRWKLVIWKSGDISQIQFVFLNISRIWRKAWYWAVFSRSSELEFLNKMPNPGILESRDLRWGGIQKYFILLNYFLNIAL
jgi:hypothetical protein